MNEQDSDPSQSDLANDSTLAEPLPPYVTLLYWQIELHELLAGNRTAGIIHAMGSAADYVKTLFPRGAKKDVAKYFCLEALNGILIEESLVSFPAYALNHLLDLILEFKPRNGFPAVVTFLKLGGTAESDFVPIGAAVAFDLHEKTLATLGAYYDVPAIDQAEPAFLTYVEILKQQLHAGYRGYAAFELLKLEVLQPDSIEFKLFIDQHPESLNEILLNLSHYATAGYGHKDIRTLFYVCLESGKEVFKSLLDAIEALGGELEPVEQEDPRRVSETLEVPDLSLRLLGDTVISINLEQEQVKLVNSYRYQKDMQRDVTRLLFEASLSQPRRRELATALFAKSCINVPSIQLFAAEMEHNGARLITDSDNNTPYIKHKTGEISIELRSIQPIRWQTYLTYLNEVEEIPVEPSDIEETIKETVEAAGIAFSATG